MSGKRPRKGTENDKNEMLEDEEYDEIENDKNEMLEDEEYDEIENDDFMPRKGKLNESLSRLAPARAPAVIFGSKQTRRILISKEENKQRRQDAEKKKLEDAENKRLEDENAAREQAQFHPTAAAVTIRPKFVENPDISLEDARKEWERSLRAPEKQSRQEQDELNEENRNKILSVAKRTVARWGKPFELQLQKVKFIKRRPNSGKFEKIPRQKIEASHRGFSRDTRDIVADDTQFDDITCLPMFPIIALRQDVKYYYDFLFALPPLAAAADLLCRVRPYLYMTEDEIKQREITIEQYKETLASFKHELIGPVTEWRRKWNTLQNHALIGDYRKALDDLLQKQIVDETETHTLKRTLSDVIVRKKCLDDNSVKRTLSTAGRMENTQALSRQFGTSRNYYVPSWNEYEQIYLHNLANVTDRNNRMPNLILTSFYQNVRSVAIPVQKAPTCANRVNLINADPAERANDSDIITFWSRFKNWWSPIPLEVIPLFEARVVRDRGGGGSSIEQFKHSTEYQQIPVDFSNVRDKDGKLSIGARFLRSGLKYDREVALEQLYSLACLNALTSDQEDIKSNAINQLKKLNRLKTLARGIPNEISDEMTQFVYGTIQSNIHSNIVTRREMADVRKARKQPYSIPNATEQAKSIFDEVIRRYGEQQALYFFETTGEGEFIQPYEQKSSSGGGGGSCTTTNFNRDSAISSIVNLTEQLANGVGSLLSASEVIVDICDNNENVILGSLGIACEGGGGGGGGAMVSQDVDIDDDQLLRGSASAGGGGMDLGGGTRRRKGTKRGKKSRKAKRGKKTRRKGKRRRGRKTRK
jgi:hypothetical protein